MKNRLPRSHLYDTIKITKEDLDSNEIKEVIMARRKKEVEQEFNIWQGKDGRWKAYIQEPGEKRKLITAKDRDILLERMVEHKFGILENPTIESLFDEWLKEKLEFNEISEQSASRYRQDFQRFFVRYSWDKKRVLSISMNELTDYVKKTIVDENLTKKTFGNFRIIIRGIFAQAKKKGCVDFNIRTLIDDMFISKKSFAVKKKNLEDEILSDEEVEKMKSYLLENKSVMGMAILLDLYTGLRIGELVSLKKSDFVDGEYLHIQRTEIAVHGKYQKDKRISATEIQENTKTEAGDRLVYLSEEAQEIVQWLLDYPRNDTEWLFVSRNQNRIVRSTLHRHLSQVCDAIDIPRKSMHKIRKTYASRLLDSGVNENIICKQLGHTTIDITKNYYYFTHQARQEQKEQLSSAVKDYDKNRIKNEPNHRPALKLVTSNFRRVAGDS